jgi:hypothetical protein
MPKERMDVKASDNVYLHKDFHGALSTGIEYLHTKYGEEAVIDYLKQFTRDFYKPLTEAIKVRGLTAIKEHYERIYQIEGGEVEFEDKPDELVMRVLASPAVMHMRANNYPIARMFVETIRTVNETLCEGTEYTAELLEYDEQTGRNVLRFRRIGR